MAFFKEQEQNVFNNYSYIEYETREKARQIQIQPKSTVLSFKDCNLEFYRIHQCRLKQVYRYYLYVSYLQQIPLENDSLFLEAALTLSRRRQRLYSWPLWEAQPRILRSPSHTFVSVKKARCCPRKRSQFSEPITKNAVR